MMPPVAVFDVNETLSDTGVLGRQFAALGAPADLATTWFDAVLQDGFALTAAGAHADFATIARNVAKSLLHTQRIAGDVDAAVETVMAGFSELPVHDDVVAGVRALRRAGWRLVTLSNGSADIGEALLRRAGVRDEFDAVLSVAQAPLWKPAASAYGYALAACGITAADATLVSVHPWDIHGASTAGWATCWVNRDGTRYPRHFRPPTVTVATIGELADTA